METVLSGGWLASLSGLPRTVIWGTAYQCKRKMPAIENSFWNIRFRKSPPEMECRNFRNGLNSPSRQLKLTFAKPSPLDGIQFLVGSDSFSVWPNGSCEDRDCWLVGVVGGLAAAVLFAGLQRADA